jgi:hypothetical protein
VDGAAVDHGHVYCPTAEELPQCSQVGPPPQPATTASIAATPASLCTTRNRTRVIGGNLTLHRRPGPWERAS